MLSKLGKAVEKRENIAEMGNNGRGFLFWTKSRVTTATRGEGTQLA